MQLKHLARMAFMIALTVVFVGSVVPGVAGGGFTLHDKVLHLCGYLSLGALAGIAWPHRRGWFFIVLPLIGLGLEIVQIYVPGRGFDWFDAAANALGAYIGVRSAPYLVSKLVRNPL